LNALTVSLILNSELYNSSTITISGLVDTLTLDGSLEMTGRDAELFGMRGVWSQRKGQLVLTADVFIAAGQMISFIVSLTNGATPRPFSALQVRPMISAALRMEYSPREVPIDKISMTFISEFILTPRDNPAFYVLMTHVSNQVKYAVSTVTVSLRANVAFLEGAKISLLGLSSSTGAGMLEIFESNTGMLSDLGEWSPHGGKLVVNVTRDCAPNTLLSMSFKLQNKGALTASQTQIAAQGGELMPNLFLAPQLMRGLTLSGAAKVSWMVKAARESTRVIRQINSVTFTIKPNAPIFEGSTVTISGLRGSMTKSCLSCRSGQLDLVAGMGCSSACSACASRNPPDASSCLPVFQEASTEVHPLFTDGLGIWDPDSGSLILTINSGQEMPSTADTLFTLMLRNKETLQSKVECSRQNTAQDILEGKCMTITASHVKLCKPGGVLGTNCENAQNTPDVFISASDVPVDPYNDTLFDVCPVCVRNEDLVVVDTTLKTITDYSIVDLPVFPPSLLGQPTLIQDGIAIGDYVMVLVLTNWLGKVGRGSWDFEKISGDYGPLEIEKYQPLLYISEANPRKLLVHQELDLLAIGKAADCQTGAQMGRKHGKIDNRIICYCFESGINNN
jgi:hypothetical protein